MQRQQSTPLTHDPILGTEINKHPTLPKNADDYRAYYGSLAWLYNPWTGKPRHAGDIGTDTFGKLIIPPGEPVVADRNQRDSGPYRDPAHPEQQLPVKYYQEGNVHYAVYGTSSISYVELLRAQLAEARKQTTE